MKRWPLRIVPTVACIVLAVLVSIQWAHSAPPQQHPRIRDAIVALREARQELQEARHDFCGRRADALRETQAALNQLQKAFQCNP